MRLVYLPAADDDLLDIYLTIGLHNEPAAAPLVDRIRTALLRLVDYPESAPAREDLGVGVRALGVVGYLAPYRLIGDEVPILRVLHSARDLSAFTADFA